MFRLKFDDINIFKLTKITTMPRQKTAGKKIGTSTKSRATAAQRTRQATARPRRRLPQLKESQEAQITPRNCGTQ